MEPSGPSSPMSMRQVPRNAHEEYGYAPPCFLSACAVFWLPALPGGVEEMGPRYGTGWVAWGLRSTRKKGERGSVCQRNGTPCDTCSRGLRTQAGKAEHGARLAPERPHHLLLRCVMCCRPPGPPLHTNPPADLYSHVQPNAQPTDRLSILHHPTLRLTARLAARRSDRRTDR